MSRLNAAQGSLRDCPRFPRPETFQGADRKIERSKSRALRDTPPLPLARSTVSLFELDGKQVVGSYRWTSCPTAEH